MAGKACSVALISATISGKLWYRESLAGKSAAAAEAGASPATRSAPSPRASAARRRGRRDALCMGTGCRMAVHGRNPASGRWMPVRTAHPVSGQREDEPDCGAACRLALDAHVAAVGDDEVPGDGEAQPGAP